MSFMSIRHGQNNIWFQFHGDVIKFVVIVINAAQMTHETCGKIAQRLKSMH